MSRRRWAADVHPGGLAGLARGAVVACCLPVLALLGCGDGGGADEEPPPTMTAAQVIAAHDDSLLALPGVVGVYEGRNDAGVTVIRVMLAEATPETERRIPKQLEGYPVELEITGRIEPLGH
jgi:hypothetical protein